MSAKFSMQPSVVGHAKHFQSFVNFKGPLSMSSWMHTYMRRSAFGRFVCPVGTWIAPSYRKTSIAI